MKKIGYITSVIFVLILITSMSHSKAIKVKKSDTFRIIKVSGRIFIVKTGVDLKMGDAYLFGTPVKFSTLRDRAAVVNRIKGRFILQPNPKGKPIVLQATSNILSRSAVSTLINPLDVKNYFSDTAVFLGDVKAKIGKEAFPLDDKHFFYVTYLYKNELIAKKIPSNDQEIEISEAKLFEIDGERVPTISTEMTLYYKKGETTSKINVFTPVFPSLEILKKEVSVLIKEFSTEMDSGQKLEEVATFVNDFYGKPRRENLNNWMEEEFSISFDKNINFK